MARTALTLVNDVVTGLNLTTNLTAANADGNSFENKNGKTRLYVKNGGGSPITVTLSTPGTVSGVQTTDITASVGAAEEWEWQGLEPGVFNYTTGVYVDYSGVTSVSVAAINPYI